MTEWHFYDKVYRRWVVLLVGSYEEFVKELDENGYKDMEWVKEQEPQGMAIELRPDNTTTNQNCTMLWLKEWNLATLVHEITHLVMMCFDQCLVPISRENTETFAFYTEYWFTEMTKARRKFPRGITPKDARR